MFQIILNFFFKNSNALKHMFWDNLKHWNLKKILLLKHVLLEISSGGDIGTGGYCPGVFCPGGILSGGILSGGILS